MQPLLKQHTHSSNPVNSAIELTSHVINFNDKVLAVDIFSYLSHLPWAIWLDSCDNSHVDSQFDILVWDPAVTLSTKNKITKIENVANNSIMTSAKDPLSLVNQAIEETFSNINVSASIKFPFKGGAVGYFAYDLGREFEILPELCEQDIHIPEMSVGIYNKAIIFDNKTQNFHLLCLENERSDIETTLFSLFKTANQNKKLEFTLDSDWLSNMTQTEYAQKFTQVHEYLLAGDCYQINLAQRFSANYSGDEFQAYKTLREENNAPFSAFIRLEDAAILSISPERFLQLNDQQVQSKPIKGTRPRHHLAELDQQAAEELKTSAKDKAENLMIVDLLRNDISKVCEAGSVVVPKLFDIESFPAVHHLVSTVEGKLSAQFNATDLLRGAFPGGSITGAPKIRAMEIIEELEPHRRSIYCGSIGYISACGNMDTSITIRTLICESNKIHCWAGGGLVADSVLADEYQETFDKVNKIIPVLKGKFLHSKT
ncbi:aminodeoxychorismate synthase component I [Pseudocolwellia agarivorans]|uniref:aminodeoxychorismate synthase component I n=1 Tax=Pseudocolwellia agarivorans TaxID=1911682 RepID=UPI0009868A03|nr:aminodeoxychorismate synthase component I [Pseudocolwellia agarivorans]